MTKAKPILVGKRRTLGGGARSWTAALYAPTASYRLHRLTFKAESEGSWSWCSRTGKTYDEAKEIFDQVELALDSHGKAPATARVQKTRTLAALAELYIAESREDGMQVRTIEGRESKVRKHIVAAGFGDALVSQWDLEVSREILKAARASVRTASGISDLRSVLSAMRTLAWRKGWLHKGIDPGRP